MFQFSEALPLSVYVHIPWCVRKCPDSVPEDRYVDALLADLENELPLIWGRSISSLFIGGGTPSLFSPEAMERLLAGLRARLALRPDMEITMEANPGTFEQEKFSAFREVGINRLSIGVQSFNDDMLTRLGRIHDGRTATMAVETAHKAGFENINLDLMFGLPKQTPEQSQHDLYTAIALEPTHISFYQLTLEPNTLFHAQPPVLPTDHTLLAMQEMGQNILANHDYNQYEVSAYARNHKHCRHNINYWEFGDYLGIGAGAHGKITDAARQSILRRKKYRQPRQYMETAAQDALEGNETRLTAADACFEFMLNALRLSEGVDTALFSQRTGLPLTAIQPLLAEAVQKGLLDVDDTRMCPSTLGKRFLNDLIALFLPDNERSN